jgi:glycosyltransferase involved in cell wall biosynthesis
MIRKILYNLLKKLYVFIFIKDYKTPSHKSKRRIFISYLSEPFYKESDIKYMNKHQNRQETLIMRDTLVELGFASHFRRFDKAILLPKKYDTIFGIEPNFIRASKANKKAIKIYYATGAYHSHQNKMVKERTDYFNLTHNTNIPYIRMVKPHESCDLADRIIQIGSKFTIKTYPEFLQNKITIIRQSCHTFHFDDFLERKFKSVKSNHFIWMGSQGSILKGLDIVLDYFLQHKESVVHIIGTIDEYVYNYYKDKINKTDNIHLYGFLDLDSSFFEKLALQSAFVIMPSASEGMPGSVINLMKLGCIPIVSCYSAFNEINDYGYLMDSITIESLDTCINESQQLTQNELRSKIENCFVFANSNFNNETFHEDLLKVFHEILNEFE